MGIFLRAIQCEYKGTYYMYNTQWLASHDEVMDGIPGIPGCVVVGSSNRLYIVWVLLMALDIGRSSRACLELGWPWFGAAVGVCLLMIVKGRQACTSDSTSSCYGML
jgi:hypothetical protein